ncbi:MAG: acyl carrier protein [Burkholderiaceae bacterium]
MTNLEIQQKLTGIFRVVFDNPTLEISNSMTAKDVENWDSLNHINLIVSVEKAFGVRFTTKEVKNLANVGDFIDLISKRVT